MTVNSAIPALGDLMYVNVSVAADATLGKRDVTMTNCDSGGSSTKVGGFTVTAGVEGGVTWSDRAAAGQGRTDGTLDGRPRRRRRGAVRTSRAVARAGAAVLAAFAAATSCAVATQASPRAPRRPSLATSRPGALA